MKVIEELGSDRSAEKERDQQGDEQPHGDSLMREEAEPMGAMGMPLRLAVARLIVRRCPGSPRQTLGRRERR